MDAVHRFVEGSGDRWGPLWLLHFAAALSRVFEPATTRLRMIAQQGKLAAKLSIADISGGTGQHPKSPTRPRSCIPAPVGVHNSGILAAPPRSLTEDLPQVVVLALGGKYSYNVVYSKRHISNMTPFTLPPELLDSAHLLHERGNIKDTSSSAVSTAIFYFSDQLVNRLGKPVVTGSRWIYQIGFAPLRLAKVLVKATP